MEFDVSQLGFGTGVRAPWAADPWASRGRLVAEPVSPTRSEFQRDRDRIIHTTAFRRLKHKTQVFVAHEGDHYRTRLTHTIEVAQIARALARALKLDEDLAEGVALVHDFGHTPFGHTGEEALDELLADAGGFDHNAQSLRIVTKLEQRYAEFDGLNLTWETLEGLVKHNGPLIAEGAGPVPEPIVDYNSRHDLWLATHSGLEAQVAAIADDIAYNTHDIDDGLRSGLITLEMLEELPLLARLLSEVRERYPKLEEPRLIHEVMRRQITKMVEDVIGTAQANIAEIKPQSADDVRHAGRTMAHFSEEFVAADRNIKKFLYRHLYRHPDVMRVRANATSIVRDLYAAFMADPGGMGDKHARSGIDDLPVELRARKVRDYLAGMTDTYAVAAHRRLFDHTPELR
ncbi:MAG: deoxyguanosinetriphosphate triphosphohydrolase [Hoeflea sp.]|uniref:deoxyguanosinetriphosphate triphosphohydrolase n=1 Tax=Hoeflea sp. TaxID=1940281 RepID=UPI001DA8B105|nr:deoxyguanosinetriphosphate triphosphohydrolase [Hoeflea sp.]MBU4530718.1 deoxyguanosinetriphosphate triphosphohydrolase [Alphaproteobacteria bacterium]MBU4544938.1 deoxyguanosinetriphosphate triphosphohydrolase [Alphaproteobacteria bacterium]MBU4552081.1 deoxyguanosinetriphosphate triphosphohydrolase [Alphaproteobacteria bacterium]MBV1722270.1 deoxyguanosinetriphosphate triphosphohydrolase [Hoeflea sp.]MBV1761832.1 deoxyguanosinetriphosphate triphosphohydrolase [Hoeflea sp.]